ncbi:response regulator [Deinococcus ficus]|uniref:response regulator n=1 Tax=Deinococcus ficus TaxID=317577 RepID=UPI00138AB526|nr:response regulator [Deinococcus ficus]
MDDNEADHLLLQDALDELDLSTRCRHFLDADEFLAALNRGEVAPDAVITDLNMPGRDGFALIRALHACPAWRHLPVLVFTTSPAEQDREQAAALGVEGYFVKPNSYRALVEELSVMIGLLQHRAIGGPTSGPQPSGQ